MRAAASNRVLQARLERQLAVRDGATFDVSDSEKVPYRISKSTGKALLIMALLLDLIPVVLLLVTTSLAAGATTNFVTKAACDDNFVSETVDWVFGTCSKTKTVSAAASVAKGYLFSDSAALAGGAMYFVGPILSVLATFAVTVFAFFFFLAVFAVKKVNVFSLKTKTLTTNLFTMMIEFVPFFNQLPGITFSVWRHVRIAQKEDEQKHKQHKQERAGQVQAMLARQQNVYARA